MINPLAANVIPRYFTLSNARRFYALMGDELGYGAANKKYLK